MEVSDQNYVSSVINNVLQNYHNMKLCFRSPIDLLMSVYKSPVRSIINPTMDNIKTITIGDEIYSWVIIDYLNELLVRNYNMIRSLLVNGDHNWLILPCDYDSEQFENEEINDEEIDCESNLNDDYYKYDNYIYDSDDNNIKNIFEFEDEYEDELETLQENINEKNNENIDPNMKSSKGNVNKFIEEMDFNSVSFA